MSYAEACEAARREQLVAREVARQREQGKSLEQIVHEVHVASRRLRAQSVARRSSPTGVSHQVAPVGEGRTADADLRERVRYARTFKPIEFPDETQQARVTPGRVYLPRNCRFVSGFRNQSFGK